MQKLRPPSFSSHLAVSRAPALDFLFFGPPPRYALMSPEKGFFAIGAPKMGKDFFLRVSNRNRQQFHRNIRKKLYFQKSTNLRRRLFFGRKFGGFYSRKEISFGVGCTGSKKVPPHPPTHFPLNNTHSSLEKKEAIELFIEYACGYTPNEGATPRVPHIRQSEKKNNTLFFLDDIL